jgi:hypothetical protein
MGLEKLDFKIVKRNIGKSFGHILKANDVKHHISQMQPDLMILKAPKRKMKTPVLYCVLYCVILSENDRVLAHVGISL